MLWVAKDLGRHFMKIVLKELLGFLNFVKEQINLCQINSALCRLNILIAQFRLTQLKSIFDCVDCTFLVFVFLEGASDFGQNFYLSQVVILLVKDFTVANHRGFVLVNCGVQGCHLAIQIHFGGWSIRPGLDKLLVDLQCLLRINQSVSLS